MAFTRFRLLSLICFASFVSFSVRAQEVTGNILGRVTDASESVIANASVTVTNTQQNVILRRLKTDSNGQYAATLLPLGVYSVAVEAPGFKKTTQMGIELTANQKYTADFKLEVGQVTQEVNVTAAPNQVELQTAQQSGLISGTQVRELSLNNRQFAQLVVLQPGVVSNLSDQLYVGATNPTGGNNIVGISVNGLRQSQNNWTLDGADLLDRGVNIVLQQYPSIDAIDEIKIVRSPYSAENGRDGGAQINLITRSGTNDLHGSAYEFFRNDALNANNFFNNLSKVPRPPLRYNDFGYTIGGPVLLPRIYNGKNKTFFFFSEEFRRVINYNGSTVVVPTQAELQGIFPSAVCVGFSADGSTCTATSTTIPASQINPVAQSYIKDVFSRIPPPQSGNNLFSPIRGIFDARQEIVRIDHNFGSKLNLSGRYLHDSIPTTEPAGYSTNIFTPGVATTQTNSPGWSSVIRATSTFSPTLVNEAGWTWSHGAIYSNPVGLMASANSPDVRPTLLYPANPDRIPGLTFTGGLTSIASFGPYNNFSYNHSIFDNLTKAWGRHTVKAGAILYIYRKNENQIADGLSLPSAGSFTFANTPRPGADVTLEQAWANFLLGNVSNFIQASQDLTADFRSKAVEAYVQDDFRLRPNLTLNFGLRYSNFRQPTEHNGLLTNFDPALFNPANAFKIDPATGNRIAGTGDPFNGIIQGGKNSPFGDAVARQANLDFAPRFGFAWDPFGRGTTSVRGGYGIFYDSVLVGSLEQNLGANPTSSFTSTSIANTRLDNPAAGSPVVSLAPASPRGWDPGFKDPYAQQWSLEIQQHFAGDVLASVGYVGTKGTHLIGVIDINQVPPGAAAAAGLVPAGGFINAAIRPRLNALRPYQGYNAINMVNSAFDSNYHGLQTSVNKRFGSSGGVVTVAYTFSKCITDNASDRSNAPQNAYNIKGDRGLCVIDRRHVLTANYVYPLPFLRDTHNLLSQVAGGWELSGIVTWNTGLPITVSDGNGVDPGGLGSVNNAASTAGGRPDQVGNPNSGGAQTIYQWFNTSAFSEVPVGLNRPGNAGRFTIQGPPITRWDFSLFKTFTLHERARLQLRGEFFNLLNHTNLNNPNVTFGTANFGRVLSAHDPRQIQVGAKVSF
jgi:hypothetical protein